MITGVLLAAGTGERFGGDKLTATLPDGRTVAGAAAAAMTAELGRVVAVVRSDEGPLADILHAAGCELVVCPRAGQGMGASLACGVRTTPDARGWIIGLADMPWVDPATIRTVRMWLVGGARIVAPVYGGERGHPVGFANEFGGLLAALGSDRGARDLIAANRQQLDLFDTDDPGVLRDVDTPDDLRPRDEGAAG